MRRLKRIFEFGLVAAIAVGLYFAAAEGRERARLLADYQRLRKTTGDMEVADPSKFHVLAIPTGEPLCFAWRFHGPKGTSLAVSSSLGGSSSSGTISLSSEDVLPTVRLRVTEERGLEVHTNFQWTAGVFTTGDIGLVRLLKGRESEVVVEQLGEPLTVLKPGTHLLIRLKFSEALMRDAAKALSPQELARFPGGEFFRTEIAYNPPPTATPAGPPTGPEPSP